MTLELWMTGINDPALNPHRPELGLAVTVLVTLLVLRRYVRPTPRRLLRCLAAVGCVVVVAIMHAELSWPGQDRFAGELTPYALECSYLTAGCLLLEMLVSRRSPAIPRAYYLGPFSAQSRSARAVSATRR